MKDRQILMRIVAVLLALAGLAERATARPWPVLCLVLMVLRPAEAVARHFLADLSGSEALKPLDVAAPSNARAEALRLAVAFRMLAFALHGLVAGAPVCGLPGLHRRAAQDFFAALEHVAWGRAQAADTS